MSETLNALKQRAAEAQIKHAEAVEKANARRAIATEKLSIELANVVTSKLINHFGHVSVADLMVSQKSVERIALLRSLSGHSVEEVDFDFSIEGVHLTGTANDWGVRVFQDTHEVSLEDVLVVLPPESKSSIALKTRIEEAEAEAESLRQERADRRNAAVESLKASIAESVKSHYGIDSVIVEDLEAEHVSIVIDEKRFKARVQDRAVRSMFYADHIMVYNTDTLIKALDGTFDAELAKAAEATKAAPARQRRFFRR